MKKNKGEEKGGLMKVYSRTDLQFEVFLEIHPFWRKQAPLFLSYPGIPRVRSMGPDVTN